jgi:hypothetical protein
MILRLPDDETIPFPLTRTGGGWGPLEFKIKKKKKSLRRSNDEPISFSLTGKGLGEGPLALNIKKKIK